jgi:hypothetical protein
LLLYIFFVLFKLVELNKYNRVNDPFLEALTLP